MFSLPLQYCATATIHAQRGGGGSHIPNANYKYSLSHTTAIYCSIAKSPTLQRNLFPCAQLRPNTSKKKKKENPPKAKTENEKNI